MRDGLWKLCVPDTEAELYNLSIDLGERRTLAAQHPERVKRMLRALTAWEEDVNESAKVYER